jgi:hypothetical protein
MITEGKIVRAFGLGQDWSDPVEARIRDGVLELRAPKIYPHVVGRCPVCAGNLYLRHGRVRCVDLDCPDPYAASLVLER